MIDEINEAINTIECYKGAIPLNNNALMTLIKSSKALIEVKQIVDNIYYNQHYNNDGFNKARLILDKALENIQ